MENAISVKKSIAELGTSEIARAMGVGISTVNGWKQADALPGATRVSNRGLYEQRLKAFIEAVQKLRSRKPKGAKAVARKGRAA